MLLTVLTIPDPRLHIVADAVTQFDSTLRTFVDDMFETMYHEDGIGLAAIQVGVPLRVVVMDEHTRNKQRVLPRVFINPEIISQSSTCITQDEYCLSVPGASGVPVTRPESVRIRYQDLESQWHEEDISAHTARCLQHEIDHLNGIVMVDYVSRLKRDRITAQVKKHLRLSPIK